MNSIEGYCLVSLNEELYYMCKHMIENIRPNIELFQYLRNSVNVDMEK